MGDAVTARMTEPTKLKDGTEIPKGTHILGSVTEIKLKADKEGPSKIGLLFDKAQLKDGRVVPLIMALVSVAPPWEAGGVDPMGADKMAGSAARTADMQQAAGAAGEVGLTSSTSVRGTKPVSAAAMQPGVCYLPDIKIASVSLGPPGTILESALESCGMSQQVANGHPGDAIVFTVNAREFGDVLEDRIVEGELAAVGSCMMATAVKVLVPDPQ